MQLISLKLTNFMGAKEFEFRPECRNVFVLGDNGAGKTTLFDSYTWLLFGKDSHGKWDFDIKTLRTDGSVISGLEHGVEGKFLINEQEITLAKVLKEKWVKKRGHAEQEFAGNTTDYWVNGVPKAKKEYDSVVAGIADESQFKLLSNPGWFNTQLHWTDRRKILLEICGDISDAEVIASDAKLAKLTEILGSRSLDDHRKVIAARKTALNKEIEKIPVRIDEVFRGLPDISELNKSELEQTLSDQKAEKNALGQRLLEVKSGGEVARKRVEVQNLAAKLQQIKNDHNANLSKALESQLQDKKGAQRHCRFEIDGMNDIIKTHESGIKLRESEAEKLKDQIENKRNLWNEENQKQFEFTAEQVCPTCGQALPEEQVQAAIEKAQADFNRKKAERLAEITADGKELKEKLDRCTSLIESNKEAISSLISKNKPVSVQLETLTNEIEQLTKQLNECPDVTTNPEYIATNSAKAQLEAEIASLSADNSKSIEGINYLITQADGYIATTESSLKSIDDFNKGQKRIEELKSQEKELAAEYANLEKELFLTEEFIRTKVAMLEGKINSRFQLTKWKMFETQLNGGLVECCEATYKGVPYGSSLNNGAKVNVDLDIINVLAEYYGFTPPVWVDNAESVSELLKTNGQKICLVVSRDDKKLRVEVA